jgi:hypothetical protein
MTPRQFAILMSLLSTGIVVASMTRTGNQGTTAEAEPLPAKAAVAALDTPDRREQPNSSIRVVLPSPYKVR